MDERPLVKDLLEKYEAASASVHEKILADEERKALCEKDKNAKRYDDIWILRYVLSYRGNVNTAAKATIKGIKYREEKKLNELGDIRHRLRNHGVPNPNEGALDDIEALPGYKLLESFCSENATFNTLPNNDRGIVTYYDVGKMDQHGIAEDVNKEQLMEYQTYSNEAIFQILDENTRCTGRLTK